jgi:spermidine/putrescine transport system ATP-binding protein
MQLELKRIQKQVGTTFIYVTHDQGEALTMSDNIAVMNMGKVEQIGTPREIYDKPKTQFVANFIGETNFLDGNLGDSAEFVSKGLPHAILVEAEEWMGEGVLSIRPERVSIGPGLKGLDNMFDAKVEDFVYQGSHVSVSVRVGDNVPLKIRSNPTVPLKTGEKTHIGWNRIDATVIRLEKH